MTSNASSTGIADPIDGVQAEPTHPLAEAGRDAGETIGHIAERAGSMGLQRADQAREVAADGLGQLADTVRRVSGDLETQQPMIAGVVTTAAEQTERLAGYLRQTDAREIVDTVQDVARRQPLLFVGGAFVLGLAASRFIKAAAGGNQQTSGGYQQMSGSGYGGYTGTSSDLRSYDIDASAATYGEDVRP
jgi:hypothetical protein